MTVTTQTQTPAAPLTWTTICALDDLAPDRGAAALVDGRQVAVFRLSWTDTVYAVGHRDPFTGANVMARGLVGTRGDRPTVASPLHKQVFDLGTGEALDYPGTSLERWDVRLVDRAVQVRPVEGVR